MQCKHPCETSWCYPEQEVMTVVTLVIFYVETEWCKTCPVEYHHSRDIKVEHDTELYRCIQGRRQVENSGVDRRRE